MIKRLLIANRGEIACRIARSAHDMGIETVAVASAIETDALHARSCDHAVEIGPAPAAESYLVIDKIIEAARATGADAIHPGYGFLAENADFARRVREAGLIFVGPSAEVIDTLGSKLRASELARAAGIEPIPRFEVGSRPDRFPVMVKAADGGGGKGMSIVRSADDLDAAIDSAARIARASFASDALIVEEYLEGARHIEVQILADSHGNVVHLGERECSIQRRHQKIIEEAPAVALASETRARMTEAATTLARNVGYESAGTVEMILAPDGRFFFLEVNTRLQVEHAVTEMTTGIDIVAEQLRIASGAPLSFTQNEVRFTGAAIEARIYAEDPAAGDLPATGTIRALREPTGAGVRVDSGLLVNQVIGIDYDPMLAKIIAHGSDRSEACARLRRALGELRLVGVASNRAALRRVLGLEAFGRGELDTEFWSRHRDAITGAATDAATGGEDEAWAAIAVTVAGALERGAAREVLRHLPLGFRLGQPAESIETLESSRACHEVRYVARGRDRFHVTLGDISEELRVTIAPRPGGGELVTMWRPDGRRLQLSVYSNNRGRAVTACTADGDWSFTRPPRFGDASASASTGDCTAPMPGRVAAVHVAVGDIVTEGQPLLVLEAMKMEHPLCAPHAGEVTEISASVGDQVDADQVLAVVTPPE